MEIQHLLSKNVGLVAPMLTPMVLNYNQLNDMVNNRMHNKLPIKCSLKSISQYIVYVGIKLFYFKLTNKI